MISDSNDLPVKDRLIRRKEFFKAQFNTMLSAVPNIVDKVDILA